MKKTVLKTLQVFLLVVLFGVVSFGIFYISGGLNYASGIVPRLMTAINVPLSINYWQAGDLSKDFAGMAALKLHVPKNTASVSGTTFEASLRIAGDKYLPKYSGNGSILGNKIFGINVSDSSTDDNSNFENVLTVVIDLPEIRANYSNLDVYRFNLEAERWELVSEVYFDLNAGQATFDTYALSDFAIIDNDGSRFIAAGIGDDDGVVVLGISYLADGALIRGSDWRVYVVTQGMKMPIRTLDQLARYSGQAIFNVDDATLSQYPTTQVLGVDNYSYNDGFNYRDDYDCGYGYGNGALLRGSDWKVYVIDNGYKRLLRTRWDLEPYAGQQIHNVSDSILAQY